MSHMPVEVVGALKAMMTRVRCPRIVVRSHAVMNTATARGKNSA